MKLKVSKLIVCLLFGHSLAGLVFIGTKTASGATLEELQERIEELNEQRKKLEQESQKYREQINEKQEEIRSLEATIQSLRARESKLRVDINLTENSLAQTREQIKKLTLEINNKKEKISEAEKILGRLLRSYSRKEEISTLEVVFSEADISELIARVKDLSLIQDNMQKRLTELKQTKEELTQSKREAEQKRKSLEQLKEQKEAQRIALERTEAQKANYLAQTRQEKSEYNQRLQEALQERRELFARVKKLQEQAERRKNFRVYVDSGKKPEPGTKVFQWPEGGAQVTQRFGNTGFAQRYDGYNFHYGLDMAAGEGSPIKAAAEGKVLASGSDSLWGNWVAISHEIGLVTLYAHLLKPASVSEGQTVAAGEVIGYEGSTGNTWPPGGGNHLHFGVYESFFTYLSGGSERPCYSRSDSCRPIDPQTYL
jgi:murein DD-endopeptidase MepM/ murein hydrolase activator NlpD